MNGLKLKEKSFGLDIRKKIFVEKVVMHWNKIPRGVGDAPHLEVFKANLDEALTNLF